MKSKILLPAILLFLAAGFSSPAFGQCLEGNCQNGYGTLVFSDGSKYVGEFLNGQCHGEGTCYYANGDVYIGEWRYHKADGIGTKYVKGGSTLAGNWSAAKYLGPTAKTGCISGNCVNGTGTYVYDNGTTYTGGFKDGLLSGQGVCKFANGDRYDGQWESHKQNGQGTYTYASSNTSKTGYWKNNEFIGANTGNTTGCISGNCVDGYGVYKYTDGTVYDGNFAGGKCSGKGTCTWVSGNKYTGEWADHQMNGYGTMYYPDGTSKTGNWAASKFLGAGAMANTNTNTNTNTNSGGNNPTGFYTEKTNDGSQPKVWAVVVGVATYQHINSLRYPDDDAYKIYAFLKSPEGGALPDAQLKVLVDEDATASKIKTTMKNLYAQAGPNDLILFYFAGHGMEGAFIPSDYDGVNNKLSHIEISEILKNSPAKNKVCVADACHSGSLTYARTASSAYDNYYNALKESKAGTALIMSSMAEETSIEFNNFRQGAFSYFFIKGLAGEADLDKNKLITVTELYSYVQKNVASYTNYRQNPVISGDYDRTMPVGVVR